MRIDTRAVGWLLAVLTLLAVVVVAGDVAHQSWEIDRARHAGDAAIQPGMPGPRGHARSAARPPVAEEGGSVVPLTLSGSPTDPASTATVESGGRAWILRSVPATTAPDEWTAWLGR